MDVVGDKCRNVLRNIATLREPGVEVKVRIKERVNLLVRSW